MDQHTQYHGLQPGTGQDDALAAQMGSMDIRGHEGQQQYQQPPRGAGTPDSYASHPQGGGTARRKKDRHAYHTIEAAGSSQPFNGMPPPGMPQSQFLDSPATGGMPPQAFSPQAGYGFVPSPAAVAQQQQFQQQQSMSPGFFPPAVGGGVPGMADAGANMAAAGGAGGPAKVSPDDLPSVPLSRDGVQPFFLRNVYPTFEKHVPPPASLSFVAFDQGNASPKFARLTANNIPSTSEGLQATGIPLGLVLQPLAPLQPGEAEIPILDFGDVGPPRCRRCRAYINPFMMFRSGGTKYVCNLCTHPNETPPEYFCATNPQGVRVDRDQRPELHRGTVEFIVPKEYWTRDPVPMRWLFVIDVTQEAYNKGFLEAFCDGILNALYGGETDGDDGAEPVRRIPQGAKVGFLSYDKEIHFYNINPSLDSAQMMIMPDIEDPFVPLGEGLFVDPYECKDVISSLLNRLPNMFSTVKNPEPALLATLNATLAALEKTGGKAICASSALPTVGPGALFMRDDGSHPGGETDKKLYTTEHPGWRKVAEKMVAAGVGVDFFFASPNGGYLDIATVGHVSSTTGGETYYYPNFIAARDGLKLSEELSHAVTRETGYQALMKVRCSNGLQISAYHGHFVQHTFGADLELGVVDADKALGVTFAYDGKLDAQLDAHFQSALLYTAASGQRRVRCTNVIASVSDTSKDSGTREQGIRDCMKFVDQDAVLSMLAKEACTKFGTTSANLRDTRNWLTERTIDILTAYRKHAPVQHAPSQLVMPERLKELSMYVLGLIKSRALKAGIETSDRRVYEMRLVRSMGPAELSVYLYPRMVALHNLQPEEGFADPETGHLKMPPAVRLSYSRVEPGGVYLVDNGQQCLLWLHAQTSPNLIADLFGAEKTTLKSLDPYTSSLPVLETHLNAQVRNILEFLRSMRGSKGLTIQLARQGLDGAELEFARLLFEDRNNEAQSYVDWLVHVHKNVQLELSGRRKKESEADMASSALGGLTGLRPSYW
ncbi:protein transport protein SEC24 [Geosmithia morbida]|uniref:Protein transport protein SEC24 n=1 Tax=Geosmithia morbida TaxID=1094350 RepID=A0A9P4YZX0_9HYPO|nr:protein transport protein SEC24 [Geosmithia morbida]KAF4126128.1 protein transport protein SEC24 [Geosmithia morbida]